MSSTSPSSSSGQSSITAADVRALLQIFSTHHYSPLDTDQTIEAIENRCLQLISKDYPNLTIIANKNGELSDSYPSQIIIPDIDDQSENGTSNKNRLDVSELKELMSKARIARCRARFPIPVILYRGKYICRSATLSGGAEIYGRSVIDTLNGTKSNNKQMNPSKFYDNDNDIEDIVDGEAINNNNKSYSIGDTSQFFSKVRSQDIKLLKQWNILHICDLMVENKKVKFWMNVTSSEKIDKENRYSDFNIISLPYPGCEFFREYRDNSYSGDGLVYNWNQNFVDAKLDIPELERVEAHLGISLNDYRQWDITKLTLSYVRLLLYYLREYDSSLLIHCISGWDRTPLFISLLRLTLWADGEIHASLSPMEIMYLTVAYDWFLFGHNLNDRLTKGEEIMFFCFQFLKFITDSDFENGYKPQIDALARTKNNDAVKQRKISLDLISNSEDFPIMDNLSGSLCSLTSNISVISEEHIMSHVHNTNGHYRHKEAVYALASSPPEMLQLNSNNGSVENIPLEKLTLLADEMESTLTTSSLFSESTMASIMMESGQEASALSSKPMAIPRNNAKKYSFNDGDVHNKSLGSLSRSDSWQLVTNAGSIRDNYFVNHFSSPDSLSSCKRNNSVTSVLNNSSANSNSPHSGSGSKKTATERLVKASRRRERLNEVRSLFNSAYTSLSFDFNNAGRWIFSKPRTKTTKL